MPGIEKLAAETRTALRVNLAVSLNATTDAVRDELMPINKKWNIARLLEAVRAFPLEKRRRVTFEYVLLDGVNDSDADAERLPRLLRGIPSKVNLIPWNPHQLTDGSFAIAAPPTSGCARSRRRSRRAASPCTCAVRAATTSTPPAVSSRPRAPAAPAHPYLCVHGELARQAQHRLSLHHALRSGPP